MRRIKLTVAYDGTEYAGWQVQDNALAIEEILNKAISEALGEEIRVLGASRTDAGVHARGNVAVFDTESAIPADRYFYSINERLPRDIVVVDSREVPMDFHPRYQKTEKTYEYVIFNARQRDPLKSRYTGFCYYPLELSKMEEGAAYLRGRHDFASFCSANSDVVDTVRTIRELTVTERAVEVRDPGTGIFRPLTEAEEGMDRKQAFLEGNLRREIVLRVRGDGFLYHMVRLIAGVLIRAGSGYYPPEEVKAILDKEQRGLAMPTAPASGLTLVSIEYPEQAAGASLDQGE